MLRIHPAYLLMENGSPIITNGVSVSFDICSLITRQKDFSHRMGRFRNFSHWTWLHLFWQITEQISCLEQTRRYESTTRSLDKGTKQPVQVLFLKLCCYDLKSSHRKERMSTERRAIQGTVYGCYLHILACLFSGKRSVILNPHSSRHNLFQFSHVGS